MKINCEAFASTITGVCCVKVKKDMETSNSKLMDAKSSDNCSTLKQAAEKFQISHKAFIQLNHTKTITKVTL